jgi:hypothetical protein
MNDEKIFSIKDVREFLKAPQKKYDSFAEFVGDIDLTHNERFTGLTKPLSLFISRFDQNKENTQFMWKAARQQGKTTGGLLWTLYNAHTSKQTDGLHLVVTHTYCMASLMFDYTVKFIENMKSNDLGMYWKVCWEIDNVNKEIYNTMSKSKIKFTSIGEELNKYTLRNLMSVYLDEAAYMDMKQYEKMVYLIADCSRTLTVSGKLTRFPKTLVASSPTNDENHPFTMASDTNRRIKVESEDRKDRVKPHSSYLETNIYDNIPEGMTASEVFDDKVKHLGYRNVMSKEDVLFS